MKNIALLITVLLLFVGCSTLKVTTDFDDDFDFSKQKSFAVKHENKEGEDTLSNDRITNSLEADLILKGYKKVSQEEAELIFVFHVEAKKRIDIQPEFQVMGFGGYGYGGAMVSTSTTRDYTEGTLIVDALNPKNEKIVWRAVGVTELKEQKTPKKRKEYIDGIIKKMMMSFPK